PLRRLAPMTSLRFLLQSARSLPQPLPSPPPCYALPWDCFDPLWNCFDVRIAVRNQGFHFPSIQARSHKNSAFISFLDYFRRGSSLGKETRSPKASIFLYSSLLFSTLLYLFLPNSLLRTNLQFAFFNFQFAIPSAILNLQSLPPPVAK